MVLFVFNLNTTGHISIADEIAVGNGPVSSRVALSGEIESFAMSFVLYAAAAKQLVLRPKSHLYQHGWFSRCASY